ncbi:MAG: EAL domain-containing response regulator [Pseudomonadota bacterium]
MDIAHWRILVAEGDHGQRQEVTAMLGRLGAVGLSEAADGHSALRGFHCGLPQAPDIGIIDLALPGLDGLGLMRQLSEAQCRSGLIVSSVHSSAVLYSVETMAEAYGLDLLGTLAKPVTEYRLATLIGNHQGAQPGPAPCQTPLCDFADIGRGLLDGQFVPYFQPKIELASGQVTGLEMFARWNHPRHGLLGPAAFMGALEERGRVDFLDWSMIAQSVAACRQMHERGLPLSVSINVAPSTLAQPSFMTQMSACLERHRMLPDYLSFELPEAAMLHIDPHFLERLLRLRMMGFGLAIDDFGTGHSNLQLLASIPFSELKIDRSFVDGAARKRPLGTVLASYLGLARSLERRSVAVGVETRSDWEFLQRLGCDCAQGFYIARPMPIETFPHWLADWRHYF